jgi:hypothetical protein
MSGGHAEAGPCKLRVCPVQRETVGVGFLWTRDGPMLAVATREQS